MKYKLSFMLMLVLMSLLVVGCSGAGGGLPDEAVQVLDFDIRDLNGFPSMKYRGNYEITSVHQFDHARADEAYCVTVRPPIPHSNQWESATYSRFTVSRVGLLWSSHASEFNGGNRDNWLRAGCPNWNE